LGSAIKGLRQGRPDSPRLKPITQSKLSLEAFCLRYLAHHFTAPFCEMHYDIFKACDAQVHGKRFARIAPRKMGKTTIINLGLPLQKLAYQEKWYILMIGESADTAEANLATLAHEIETNELLLEDFPHLRAAVDPRGQTVKWTDRQLVFANYATVRAKGMGARMRGMKYRQRRPDMAILDDPESPETADTFLKRERHKRWFGGTFMGLGTSDWDVYVIGNLPHHDCLIAGLVLDPRWDGKLWRAENIPKRENERYPVGNTKEDGSALWPEEWPLARLEQYRNEPNVGNLGYAREMMNDPREEENKAFSLSEFEFFNYEEEKPTYDEMVISIDPAGGENPGEVRRGKRDYCAVVAMGRKRDNTIDVVDAVLKKVLPDAQIDIALDMYTRYEASISVEENMYKNLLKTSMEKRAKERGLYPVVRVRTSAQNKITRILSLQPPIRRRNIRFAAHLIEKAPELFAQFDEFPGTYDDGPDAVEGGLRQLERRASQAFKLISMTGQSYWKNRT
jgi:predicted phage terminase large subunit-like protein